MRRTVPLALALALAACGGSGGGAAPPRTATPVPAGTSPGVTAFAQTVPAEDGLGEVFPGQANTWILDRDFSLTQGYGLQFTTALALYLGAPTAPVTHASLTDDLVAGRLDFFPGDQDVAEIAFLTPLFTSADGVRIAAASDGLSIGIPALSGARSGYLNGTSDSRLFRDVTLAPGASRSLAWSDRGVLRAGNLLGASSPPDAPAYRVVIRSPATGAVLQEIFSTSSDFGAGAPLSHAVPLDGGLSGPVRISFELRSAAEGFVVLDGVVLSDGAGPVAGFTNGDFEDAGLAPWVAGSGAESQNVRSGARVVTLAGGAGPALSVTRTFYAPPGAEWGRLVDVFENTSASRISTTAVYLTGLAGALPVAALRAGGAAIVGWDALGGARDVALVLGSGTGHVDPASGDLFAVHALDVPAGGKAAIAHFVVQLGRTEGGPTTADVPPGVDAAAQAIAAGFPSQEGYAIDLEPGLLGLISNF